MGPLEFGWFSFPRLLPDGGVNGRKPSFELGRLVLPLLELPRAALLAAGVLLFPGGVNGRKPSFDRFGAADEGRFVAAGVFTLASRGDIAGE